MAANTAEFSVSVNAYGDSGETRPKDEQAIVMNIDKDTPVKTYILELNNHINDPKSFLYGSRISRERLCVVLASAAQAELLVEKVGAINVNNVEVRIDYFVKKAVKVIISNAGYGVSNSAIKKFLTKDCKIRTTSSVSELKSNMGQDLNDTWNMKSFRRVVYIHPEDVHKIPSKPIKFYTPAVGYNVFFELDVPKCFNCKSPGHFAASCTEERKSETIKTINANISPSQNGRESPFVIDDDDNSSSSNVNTGVNVNKQLFHDDINQKVIRSASDTQSIESEQESKKKVTQESFTSQIAVFNEETMETNFDASQAGIFKRPLDTDSQSCSGSSISATNVTKEKSKSTRTAPKKVSKKPRVEQEFTGDDLRFKISSLLENARSYIEATRESHSLNFEKFVELVVKSSSLCREERRKVISGYTRNHSEFIDLLTKVHTLVGGRGIKSRLTAIKKAMESPNCRDGLEYSSELSSFSESEHE